MFTAEKLERDMIMGKQNELSENLNNWDYISRYSLWMYHTYEKYVGKKVLDVGAGMGRMVAFYIDKCEEVVATDIFQSQVDYMNERFKGYSNFSAIVCDIMKDNMGQYKEKFDTIICINVLEHLEDDLLAVQKMKEMLMDRGKIILFVSALQKLYCQMDSNVNHYRRYDKGELKKIADECDLTVEYNKYFNALGIIPYYIRGKKKFKSGESFSTSLNENNSKIYNLASKILEPIERKISIPFGLSEIIVLEKKGIYE